MDNSILFFSRAPPVVAVWPLPGIDRETCYACARQIGNAGQMWVKFAEAIRTGTRIESDFDSAARRHRILDAIVLASQTGQRQKVVL